jgi:deazaflavin-dependent oxidoreductase (nitroreductase family)
MRNDQLVRALLFDRRLLMEHVKKASRRWMYGGKRPNRVAALLNRGTAALVAAGIGPKRLVTLEVQGRRTGRRLSFPVVIAEYDGQRYLVAMLGKEANWVRNVRAAGGKAVLRHGRREDVGLDEVDPSMRSPILRRYLEVAPGGRAHFPIDQGAPLEQFEQISEQYPVFRIRVDSAR